jgi:hypothetical protein
LKTKIFLQRGLDDPNHIEKSQQIDLYAQPVGLLARPADGPGCSAVRCRVRPTGKSPDRGEHAFRVPDAVQRSPGDAQHRPVTLLRSAGTYSRVSIPMDSGRRSAAMAISSTLASSAG